MGVTSADIAERAGVSRATVSYVLNDNPRQSISPATRATVLQAARDLGYRPNVAAQALRSGRGRAVVFPLPGLGHTHIVTQLIGACQSALDDFGLALEPAMPKGELVVERAGSGQFMIEVGGRSAHVGRDFTSGISAVTKLAECIQHVASLPDPARSIIANIGPIEGSTATNVVPDRARAWGNVRFPGKAASESLETAIVSLATPEESMPRVTVRTSFNRPAKPMTPEVERLALEARRAAEDLGQSLPFGKTGGVCDGNILQDAGLPTIDTLGVRGGGLHTPQEWIEIPSLVERCQLLAILIFRLSGHA